MQNETKEKSKQSGTIKLSQSEKQTKRNVQRVTKWEINKKRNTKFIRKVKYQQSKVINKKCTQSQKMKKWTGFAKVGNQQNKIYKVCAKWKINKTKYTKCAQCENPTDQCTSCAQRKQKKN